MTIMITIQIVIFGPASSLYGALERHLFEMSALMGNYCWETRSEELEGARKSATRNWDGVQYFGCCGFLEPNDWLEFRPANASRDSYPPSCCKSYQLGGPKRACYNSLPGFYALGCYEKLKSAAAPLSMTTTFIIVLYLVYGTIAWRLSKGFRRLTRRPTFGNLYRV